ncbi:unnamed protein product [Durusdinium trenchii]|uniref:Helicase ATP-binding domain-containing protein n=1 Tax=Durusdinium trenchii TaxID=1381693 RepID=A0ABP0PF74_9DINO
MHSTGDLRSLFVCGAGRSPWQHQLEAVRSILKALQEDWASGEQRRNLLVQHATGSGKSLTMALLVECLQDVHDSQGRGFALVFVLSDRLQLDRQLGDTVDSFRSRVARGAPGPRRRGPLRRAEESRQCLAKALSSAVHAELERCVTVVTTKQKLDRFLLESDSKHRRGWLAPIFKRGRVAVICEECHRAHFHGCATGAAVARLFGDQGRAQPADLVYIGFTGTPSQSALELFGRSESSQTETGETVVGSVHCYHLGEAEAEGVVLDVLANYESVNIEDVSGKCAFILADMQRLAHVYPPDFAAVMKGMVVCRSRSEVLGFVRTLRTATACGAPWVLPGSCGRSQGFHFNRGICGFFSGAVEDLVEEQLNGCSLLEACRTARILVVCNKLETGFDEPRLAVLYLNRCLESNVKVVQVLSRINRPFSGKPFAFIRDFHSQGSLAKASFEAFRRRVVNNSKPKEVRACSEHRLGGLLSARRLKRQALPALLSGKMVFIDEKVASSLLHQVVPSSRYGGKPKSRRKWISWAGSSRLTAQPQQMLEAAFKESMSKAIGFSSQEARMRLVADGEPGAAAVLRGPAQRLQDFWQAVEEHRRSYFEVEPTLRRANKEVPYPVFICSKGRASSGFLEWRAAHCLGPNSAGVCPVVIVVEPQEESTYRLHWPDAILLVLSRPAETAIGYARWVVQKICTSSRCAGRHLQLPFIWMADDLLLSFYRIERLQYGGKRRRILRALPQRGFWEAFVAVQQRQDICEMAVAGFLRDRGASSLVKRDWVIDDSLALQKVVLLNLVQLQSLQVEYCPWLRKSEDLAIAYQVAKEPGGHLLKCHRYTYRARHLARSGAEEVRRLCAEPRGPELPRLLLGGAEQRRRLPVRQKSAVDALVEWLRRYRTAEPVTGAVDAHGDWDDGADAASFQLLREEGSRKQGFMEWLAKLPKALNDS